MSRTAVTTAVGVDDVPEPIRSLSTLTSSDYVDAYTASVDGADATSPELWARAVLEEAPVSRRSAYALWSLLGLRLGPRNSPAHVQGWRIADRGERWIRLTTASWYLTAEAAVQVREDDVTVAVFLRFDHPVATLVWGPVGVLHRRTVPVMVQQAVVLRSAALR